MSRIAPIKWRRFEKFLFAVGCKFIRQESSHRVYWKEGLNRPIILPTYDPVPVFIIKNTLRSLGIDNMTYLKILRKTK
ncbi:type II toxin-antitoxin system HicA family toxin [Candidatus Saccharibacteria bacterium]|nr:type II toxin-antitoxin system HicA family toxin [Candidatus Saccharibacteria bacterium]